MIALTSFFRSSVLLCGLTCAVIAPGPAHAETTPLHAAVRARDLPALQRALLDSAARARKDERDAQGRTALLWAVDLNQLGAVQALLQAGADVNLQDAQLDSPYLLAGAQGRLEILRLLLTHGADLRSTNRYGGTALIPAAERGHVEVVRSLIAAGVAVDHVNRLGWTALLEAIVLSNGGPAHQDIVRQLIAAGADVNLPDRDGVTPLQHARQRGYTAIAESLRSAGAR